jgi:deoxyribodipyrimidine photolyase-related protein
MKKYYDYCLKYFDEIEYINSSDKNSDITVLLEKLSKSNIKKINYIDPCDNWLEERINNVDSIKINRIESLQFLNTETENQIFFNPSKKKYFQTSFYKLQRKKMNILMVGNDPMGNKWTYDDENRKKYPKSKVPPTIKYPKENKEFCEEGINYVNTYFRENYGVLNGTISYPTDFTSSKNWFNDFLNERFAEFGDYEDAIVEKEAILNHSLLSPLLNSGLLTPKYVINELNKYGIKKNIPINSFEGIVRQIIGWREFIRGIYIAKGSIERTRNYWNFDKKMPKAFYNATTGIKPVDDCINKVNDNAYLHHIERLMVIGNFMFLCEIHPDDVYKWFMEFFIDSYDWVMVPNVYGMSQFADGGLMSTKPYISSSNYIMKMSDYKKGDWQKIWDGLYWRFIYKNQSFFQSNPRLSMMVRTLNKMDKQKLESHLKISEEYLSNLV